ncbi:hypothetical protein A1O7_06923 [Cladophialophora yegresii CBS 114405]|uniref:Myb-like DNA-binding domain-containing protein n=1 Tax=Cladophialophora yegresii CBS 114405 TaxID=1182544 RepID=W9WDH2_9EURO|nr:uncharacterized protein A1O7_06923 [Cladophialophora yegresii CBS 114405]EXJ56579.1 hypothetical protein A1O7_06923 [Cladophialophora yegresii CBS 114405]
MASSSTDDKIAFILTVFKHTTLPKPDYAAVAVETGINTASNAAIVKAAGFELVNDQIVGPGGSTGDGTGTAASPPKKRKPRAKKAAGEESNKKQKVKQEDDAEVQTNQGVEASTN